ncbi:MAG: hypothetical protein UX80_C0024G0001 [Candidatus Amesbacteria bacterium GW2011_GWA2_47_11b]|uniref:TNase-like domain-containing protein n=3 Tax=Candidatus Amesiibacteriota TaxID=1752730 RepID=A0A0G1UUJ1_9BACT|nr:MAG: hypothetical protein UX42_C0008G0013 [Microgenomates group bacterium GW2011_GWC1_46_20]KKU57135.1 MAG: hypothetical protein UX80_C0024G0001 [Candidatus Amesbacteria bacterium GW2011_GWA2_47_11b]KKU69693.1 MAG: hypothetical protein UX92_C0012G0036 [Candidatus Amesbacteria bacterium GW2011_GWA1_47_20]KKU83296.1 MAG: hypothetical protein UY11_C0023G0014 [Candidatus Amesbacteria bacterium GW2011_GWC2_47_8]
MEGVRSLGIFLRIAKRERCKLSGYSFVIKSQNNTFFATLKEVKKKRVTADWLRKIGVKEVLIPGLILAGVLGWTGWNKLDEKKVRFPESGVVRIITDGDTFELQSGVRVRLIGINAPANDARSKDGLARLVEDKRVWLEYDRYQDDKYGRVLAWIWMGCEETPKFTPPDYMRLSFNRSRPGLTENPKGCKKGKLVQEELIKEGLVKMEVYKDRGELKYENRLK